MADDAFTFQLEAGREEIGVGAFVCLKRGGAVGGNAP
jgi:hypothetical protein